MKIINWYPGHMKKTKELIQENLKMVDVVIELLDARIPISSQNPHIHELIKTKPRIIVLNKSDLADQKVNKLWVAHYKEKGFRVVVLNAMTGKGLDDLIKEVQKVKTAKDQKSTYQKITRVMVVGVPNVGKSSIINRLANKKSAQTGNKPGVTRGKQWIRLRGDIDLLDTPGILWPKFEDQRIGLKLAFTGAIRDEILDLEEIALILIGFMAKNYPDCIKQRYKIEELSEEPLEIMDAISRKRGFILSGGRIDYARTAKTFLDEFRAGKLGYVSIEKPEDLLELEQGKSDEY